MKKKAVSHGGARENAGRKPTDGVRKESVSLYLVPDIAQYLKWLGSDKHSLVANFISGLPDFKKFLKSK